jgi:UDP-N-acetylmuramyl pentapeptide phosphotransferase/UDP-N-acetylglucosamine-1-phosphate transferase
MAVLRSFGVGASVARAALGWIRRDQRAGALERTNFHGRTVSLAGGPALALGATVGAVAGAPSVRVAAASVVAGLTSGSVGFYDDISGDKAVKGFAGHLGALQEGQVTSGLVKIAGVGAAALVASAMIGSKRTSLLGRTTDVLLGAGVIAGMANFVNLLDLRPGRAIKAGLAIGAPVGGGVAAGTMGAAAALLPEDLGEEIMVGDAGANAMGALLGVALTARSGAATRLLALGALAGLTAASEKVSYTKVIQDTPWLRRLDELGRRPA